MAKYKKEDIFRMVEEEDVEFYPSSVYRHVWYVEKCSDHGWSAGKGTE